MGGLRGLAESFLCLLRAFSHLPMILSAYVLMSSVDPLPTSHPCKFSPQAPMCADRETRVKEAPSREAGKPAGPLSGAGMQKMWKQLGVRAGALKALR